MLDARGAGDRISLEGNAPLADLLRPLSAAYDPTPFDDGARAATTTRKCAKLTAADIKLVLALTRQGASAASIADQIGFSRKTIHRIRNGWQPKINHLTGAQVHAEIEVWRVLEMRRRGMLPVRIARALGVKAWSINRVLGRIGERG